MGSRDSELGIKQPERVPKVSIIVPTMNEVRNIGGALDAVISNDYPHERLEIIVVDGGSGDGTLDVVRSFSDRLAIKLITQSGCTVYQALNIGLAHTNGDVVLRVDARSVIPKNYIRQCVSHLARGDIQGVGGVQEQYGTNATGDAVAIATAHPLGTGGAAFRVGTRSGFVDTVYLGCYPRRVFDEIGRYDDDGRVVSEDSMLNKRIRENGGRIFLDHTLRVKYPAKDSIAALARQYFIYGGARAHVWLKYGTLTSPRQALPVLFLLWIFATAISSPWYSLALPAFLTTIGVYVAVICTVSFWVVYTRKRLDLFGKLAQAFVTIHFAWPVGFILRAAVPRLYFRVLGAGSK